MADESDEPDRLEGHPHPRDASGVVGHLAAQQAILDGLRAGALHHAWLIGGPEGVGKATFAYAAAKMLLGLGASRTPPAGDRFSFDPAAQAARLVATRAHPDLAVLRREYEPDKKRVPTVIGVDTVRRALDLFAATAGGAGWRVCIVDSAEDLNISSANALLKALEEPPPSCVFFIIAHQPQQVLPTIRSRCRKLSLGPLAPDDVAQVLDKVGAQATPAETARAIALADGSPRRALTRLDPEALALIDGARAQLDRLPAWDIKAIAALGDSLAGRAADQDFALFLDTVQDWMSATLAANAGAGAPRLAPLAEVWEKIARAARETDVLNLDRRPLVLSIFMDLAGAVTRMRMG
jgi:DNA polymerase-3 subunit delta'